MAEANRPSSTFLGSITPWSQSSSPGPSSPRQPPKDEAKQPNRLQQSTGVDHTISLRPSPSLRNYPKDCPPLKTKWYYAVDVAKRKPFVTESTSDDKNKPLPVPKKFVAFSTTDSQAIENAYQGLDRDGALSESTSEPACTKVPVNEDYLFDVHVEKRELEPAYWLGPTYEVRRGSWFWPESTGLRPCDENLANQLEEGYIKLAPWRKLDMSAPRSASQPRSRPTSLVLDSSSTTSQDRAPPFADDQNSQLSGAYTYRLFGAHMNTNVTYHDASTAYLLSDDVWSRMGNMSWRLTGYVGVKVVRGWTEQTKPPDIKGDSKPPEGSNIKERRKSAKITPEPAELADQPKPKTSTKSRSRPSALERQLSSLAGMPDSQDAAELAEEDAREAEEKEMEEAREKDGDDQARQIDHLVLVTHGIGQRLGLRLDSINFIHDVNTLRKSMKAVYETAPDLQALSGDPKNCRVQVLPICWRHLLDFPKQSLKHNREEFDLTDADAGLDDEYPSLQDITVEGVPAVRNLITDLAMDVLLYQSAYREHIATIVQKECNRVFQLFKQRTGFSGRVSLCGHSLGSAVLFDILCRQEEPVITRPRRVSSKTSRDTRFEQKDLSLDFEVDSFFALGSPIALFQMLKGRTIAGRQTLAGSTVPMSPFDPDPMRNDPFDSTLSKRGGGNSARDIIPISTSSPKCGSLFNIFHPTDPIAYRMEPLISPAMASLKSQPLPYTKKNLFAAPGIANLSARVGQQVMSGWYNLTSGVASSLINRSLGITGDEQALPQDKAKAAANNLAQGQQDANAANVSIPESARRQQALADAAATSPTTEIPTLIDSELETLYSGFQKRSGNNSTGANDAISAEERARKVRREEAKVRALNSNGRVDYHIQEGMFDVSLLASIASHLSYWADEDVNHFMIGQMLKQGTDGDVGRASK